METLVWFILFSPLVGVILNGLLLSGAPVSTRRRLAGPVATIMVALSFICTVTLFFNLPGFLGGEKWRDLHGYDWIVAGALNIPFALRIDPLSMTMLLVITGVGALIHLFSIEYMRHDERVYRYFTYLNLFTFAMLLLVMANNFVLMFVGWEGVGLCSYLLIGFWFERVSAAQAGKKAFLVNRVGDLGFLIGLFVLFHFTGSLIYNTPDGAGVFDRAGELSGHTIFGVTAVTMVCLLLFVGAAGKSAQLPLYLWLPDAMEGPTPVSALIHAATMVTAGVYMVARSAALFSQSPAAQLLVAAIGIATAFWAALLAIRAYDIKRVLAYSTVSQLGYMFAGVGVGAYAAGVAHLVTHAFFKALMFLGAGAVMHALDGQLDMRKMGNMKKYMKVTYLTFAVGVVAIAGVPPFAGFFSKDAILEGVWARSAEGAYATAFQVIFATGVLVAFMTAFYMTRLFVTVFHGDERIEMGDEGHGGDAQEHGPAHSHGGHHAPHVHPEASLMNLPLVLLAILSAIGGLLVIPILQGWLDPVTLGMIPGQAHAAVPEHGAEAAAHGAAAGGHAASHWDLAHVLSAWQTWVSVAAGLAGIALAAFAMGPARFARGWTPAQEGLLGLLGDNYERAMHVVFVRGGTRLAELLYWIDAHIIDGAVNAAGRLTEFTGDSMRSLQTGYVRYYAASLLVGSVFVAGCFIIAQLRMPLMTQLMILGGVMVATLAVMGVVNLMQLRAARRAAPHHGAAPPGTQS